MCLLRTIPGFSDPALRKHSLLAPVACPSSSESSSHSQSDIREDELLNDPEPSAQPVYTSGRKPVGKPNTPLCCAYNLFRRRTAPDFCCAVPVHYPVPAFLNGRWAYAGTLEDGAGRPIGFDPAAAKLGVSLSGFHLFQSARRKSAYTGLHLDQSGPSDELAAHRMASRSGWRSWPSA
jgi:hypothetical protein